MSLPSTPVDGGHGGLAEVAPLGFLPGICCSITTARRHAPFGPASDRYCPRPAWTWRWPSTTRRDPDVRALLQRHLAFACGVTPAEHSFALDADALVEPDVTFFSARCDGELLGVGALKRLDVAHAVIKSMHTAEDARRQGVGRAMVEHLVDYVLRQGYRRVSPETGTTEDFAPARAV
jgi:putative acetyltransferase